MLSDLSKYIVLVPTAEQFEASGIRTVYSTQGLEAEGDDVRREKNVHFYIETKVR